MPALFTFWFKALRWLGMMLLDGLVIGAGLVLLVSGCVIMLLAYGFLVLPGATLLGLPIWGQDQEEPPWEEDDEEGVLDW